MRFLEAGSGMAVISSTLAQDEQKESLGVWPANTNLAEWLLAILSAVFGAINGRQADAGHYGQLIAPCKAELQAQKLSI